MQRRVIVVWLLVLALIVAIVIARTIEIDGEGGHEGHAEVASDPRMLLPVDVSELSALEVFYGGTLHRFERDAAGAWYYHGVHSAGQASHTHQTDPATAKRIDEALAGFGRTRLERDFPFDKVNDAFGVTKPRMIILIYQGRDLRLLAQYAVGEIAPDGYSRYLLPVGGNTVFSIANFQIDNLVNLIQAASAPAAAPQAAKP